MLKINLVRNFAMCCIWYIISYLHTKRRILIVFERFVLKTKTKNLTLRGRRLCAVRLTVCLFVSQAHPIVHIISLVQNLVYFVKETVIILSFFVVWFLNSKFFFPVLSALCNLFSLFLKAGSIDSVCLTPYIQKLWIETGFT